MSERVLVAAVPAALIAAVAWSDGGYFPRTWGALLLLAAIALAAAAILCRAIEPDTHALLVVVGLSGLAAWQLVSRAWAVAPDGAVLEAERTLLYASVAGAAFLAVGRDRAESLVIGVALGAGATTVGGLVQHLGADVRGDRLEAPVGYANASGILAGTTLLLGLGLALGGPRPHRVLGAGLAAPAALALWLSLSRGSLVAAVLGGVVLAGTAASQRGLRRFALAAVPVGVAVSLVAGALLLTAGDERARSEAEEIGERRLLSSSSLRSDYWRVALGMVAREPLRGEGAGGFERVWLRERDELLYVRDAHNLYLETLAELGPVGLALLLVALGAPLLAARRAVGRPAGRAALAAFVALLAHAGLDWDWELPAVTVCTVLLAVALVRLGGSGERRSLRPSTRVGMVGAALAVGVVAVVAHVGNGSLAEAEEALDRNDLAVARREADRARAFAPWSAEPWLLLGQVALAEGRSGLARRDLRRAAAEDPASWDAWFEVALATSGADRARALARARRLNPLAPELDAVASVVDHP